MSIFSNWVLGPAGGGVVAPDAPDGLVLTPLGDDMQLDWNDNSDGESGFSIERSIDGVNYLEIDTVGTGIETYLDTTTANATRYYYRVRAFIGSVYSSYCASANLYTYGAELIGDPTYSNAADWSNPALVAGGKFSPVADSALNYNVYIQSHASLVAGKYKCEVYVDSYTTGTGSFYLGGTQSALSISGSGLITRVITTAASNQRAGINCLALTAVIDRISVRRDYN